MKQSDYHQKQAEACAVLARRYELTSRLFDAYTTLGANHLHLSFQFASLESNEANLNRLLDKEMWIKK